MATTREMLEAIREDCGASGASVKVGADAYRNLRNAMPEELLEAAIWSIRQSTGTKAIADQLVSYLHSGFQLAQPGGWELIAPRWLRESRKITVLSIKEEVP